ncbi:hypothetical protein [Desulfobacula toluolica]|uniref:Uncharacterized protein n=1 Tax=Desulfobacula toluolica (strain DSM 7467 / Tol2) TaxID=651182 RepID=K0NL65_DESTT|nr:hypothetical protein [Desulfobacula toluolica]CCK80713.1 uncharacterized protein TOL2_C25540 [Desulfobacula toluolica Tol2]
MIKILFKINIILTDQCQLKTQAGSTHANIRMFRSLSGAANKKALKERSKLIEISKKAKEQGLMMPW